MHHEERGPSGSRTTLLARVLAAPGRLPPPLTYAIAVALPLAMLLARLWIGPRPSELPMLALFFIPVLLAAYLGGLGPGLVATAISAAVTSWFLLPPLGSFFIARPANLVQWLILAAANGLVCVLTEALHRARREVLASARAQRLEALGTLAGGIAHDFNNILLAISGNSELARGELPAGHPAQANLDEINRASARAADLVRQILAFSRPEERRVEILQVPAVVDEALKLIRAALPATIDIRTIYASDLPPVAADPSQVHQILMNLATNAAHAMGGRTGRIEVSVDAVEAGAEAAATSPDLRPGRYCRLSVSDDGCGMDRATQARIFDPFFTTKGKAEGTGLGLSVVHGIVRSHQGAITVYSEVGKGTVFRLYFPAAAGAGAASAPPPPPKQAVTATARGEHVLYVDDEQALVFLATRMLETMGYRVTGFTDPEAALREFQRRPREFDVVVTDLSMPGLSGLDLTRALRAERPDLPVIVTSGYLGPQDLAAARSAGVRDLILKPNVVSELGAALARLFRGPPSMV